ncbi:class I SAM-dependent methyltransferase [Streptomyces sp. NPDC054871]
MADSYAGLSHHYDLIMTSGYYDYDAYTRTLLDLIQDRRVLLEVGVGTGLVCEKLLRRADTDLVITGIDHTASMLAQARSRLGSRVRLIQQDVLHMGLTTQNAQYAPYDVAFSVGGVWYHIHDQGQRQGMGQGRTMLGSHLLSNDDNLQALAHLHAALRPGGILLLAAQGPHVNHHRELPGGLLYSQHTQALGDNRFIKDYFVRKHGRTVAHQRSPYRLFTQDEANSLMEQAGFRHERVSDDGLFHQYARR